MAACRAVCLLAAIVAMPTPSLAGGLPIPFWSTGRSISTDDGYADLSWAVQGSDPVAFFRLTEVHDGESGTHFVDHPTTRVYRVEPGVYDFRVQACQPGPGGYPNCGEQSWPLRLTVTEAIESLQTERPPEDRPPGTLRNPSGFAPGLWFNPARGGHGWSFYWESHLELPEGHPEYGDAFDLLGLWYTYEAKARYIDGPPPCGEGYFGDECFWTYADYKPIAARLRLTQVSSQQYQGSITITRSGVEINEGSVTVTFDTANSALVDWDAHFHWQQLAASDGIQLLAGSNPSSTNNHTHYSGLWRPPFAYDYQVAHDLGMTSESVEVVFEDDTGDPAWIIAVADGPEPGHTDLCFAYITSGYAPDASGQLFFHEDGCDFDVPATTVNRNGFRRFTDFELEEFWIAFGLPGGNAPGGIVAGTPGFPHNLTKYASFHRIEYESASGASCEISDGSPECPVSLTWFTDGYYPATSVFVHHISNGARTYVHSATVMQNFQWAAMQAGEYEFELRMGSTAASSLMAVSDPFTVTYDEGEPPPPPPPDNQPPTVEQPPDQTDSEGQSVSLQVQASDPDGDALTYAASGLPPSLSINPAGLISGTLAAGAAAASPYAVSVTVGDPGGLEDSAAFQWTITAPAGGANPETPPPPVPAPDMTPSLPSSRTGATGGAFAVSATGSASYRIPLLSAPGSGGLAPVMALVYDSQTGNGPLGVGWRIDGFSVISRCPQTFEQDNNPAPRRISFTEQDRFCLDGERLMAVSGVYGGSGTVYRKEQDDFTRVISYGSGSDGPGHFIAWSREGAVAEFGRTPDSRIETRAKGLENVASAWAQNRLEDTSGNYIEYGYAENSPGAVDFVLEEVRYTGNVSMGTAPYAKLRFIYTNGRPDTGLVYTAGVAATHSRLLERVESHSRINAASPLSSLRSYLLDYGVDGWGRAVLESVRECRDASAAVCFPPTTFDWQKSEHQVSGTGPAANQLFTEDFRGLALADANGDGRPDLLISERDGQDFEFTVATADATGAFTLGAQRFDLPASVNPERPVAVQTIDLNADGYQDVMYPREVAGDVKWYAHLGGPGGLGKPFLILADCCSLLSPGLFQVLDFNGDGLSDILTHRPAPTFELATRIVVLINDFQPGDAEPSFQPPLLISVNYPGLFPEETTGGWQVTHEAPGFHLQTRNSLPGRVHDFNGDGAVDILVRLRRRYQSCAGGCTPLSSRGGVRSFSVFIIPDAEEGGEPPTDPRSVTAFATFYLVLYSDGADQYSTSEVIAVGAGDDCGVADLCQPYAALPAAKRMLAVDVNADGLADLAFQDGEFDWHYQLNSGKGFLSPRIIGRPPNDARSDQARFIDITGDGYPEMTYPDLIDNDRATWMVQVNDLGNGFAAPQTSTMPVGNAAQGDTGIMLDFTGDAIVDQLVIDWRPDGAGAEAGSTKLRRGINLISGLSGEAGNVIAAFEDGLGARTEVQYLPLTDANVHSRTNHSANAIWGRGSVVYDLAVPFYVVSSVSTSVPVFGAPGATSESLYHYVGAKLQAGGRGFLGFAEVVEFDPQNSLRTNTRYRQDFPFTGQIADRSVILTTFTHRFDSISDISETIPPIWPAVSAQTGRPAAGQEATIIRYKVREWNAVESAPGSNAWAIRSPAELTREHTLDGQFSSKELVTRSFDEYGNILTGQERRYEFDGTSPWSQVTTGNGWLNDDAQWRLGRLTSTQVTHWRADALASIVRRSTFSYHPQSSLLVQEVSEPGNAQRKVITDYQLDGYGNRIATTVTGIGMAPRGSAMTFDALGRFAVQSRNAYNQVTQNMLAWDVFGNPMQSRNIDKVLTISASDHMGRPFASYTQTGSWKKTLLGLGGHSRCPAGTAYHSVTTAGGSATFVDCFDRLARKQRTASEGFLGDWIYVDSYFDASGRPERLSEPYFSGQARYWNLNVYDELGRPVETTTANGLVEEMRYDAAASHCGSSGPRATLTRTLPGDGSVQERWERRNVAGEIGRTLDDDCGAAEYHYDAAGNLVKVIGIDASTIAIDYDALGLHKVQMDDPDKGLWQYASNALGEVTRQLDSKQQAVDFEYDLMGRVTHRRELTGVSSLGDQQYTVANHELRIWQNSAAPGVSGRGQLVSERYHDGEAGAVIHQRDYGYDGFGRLEQIEHLMEGRTFVETTTYDQHGRVFQRFDASGGSRGARFHYNAQGHVHKIQEAREGSSGIVYQHILSADQRGNPTAITLGNNTQLFAGYDPASGYVQTLEAYAANGQEMQFVEYDFDRLGNLESRHDRSGANNLREDFSYDALNRLEQVLLTAPQLGLNQYPTQSMAYSASGNIAFKSGVGSYIYGQGTAGPHAVTRAGNVNYSYDANGNQVSSSDGRVISYSVFDQATRIQKGLDVTEFRYGLANQRFKRVDDNDVDQQKTTWTIGAVELIEVPGSQPFFKRHIGSAAIVDFRPASGVSETWYLATDHLGSIHSISNNVGQKVWESHFGPWGMRQGSDWQSPLVAVAAGASNAFTTRGFTGHEHADGLGIIHMNGRIYDPRLGRFLQADPFVQAPKNGQTLNRYTYALNNPLSYTDPSGFFLKRLIRKWGRVIVAVVASYFTYGAASGWAASFMSATGAAAFGGAAAGFVGGAIISGSLQGAVKGAFAGALTGGIAGHFGDTYSTSRILADSFAGGLAAEFYGESFKDGLMFAALTSLATYINVRLRVYQKRMSQLSPGQVAPNNPGFRGITGGEAGERIYSEYWVKSGAEAAVRTGVMSVEEAIETLYLPYRKSLGPLSPLGCFQGSDEGCIFGWKYDPNGNAIERFANHILEGYAGPHDTLNSWYFYDQYGMNRTFTSFGKWFGQFLNPLNVLLASPIVIPSLIPDYSRHLFYTSLNEQ